MAEDLDYVPMPDNVVAAIQKIWAAEIKDASGKPLFTACPLIAYETGNGSARSRLPRRPVDAQAGAMSGLHCGR